jgi:hypothetical protein
MTETKPAVRLTGGCQCGAVRYALTAMPAKPCICYCRMCQKASGNILATFATVAMGDFELTRGEVTWWASSEQGERGFCATCGTPVLWRNPLETNVMSTTLGSLDHPELVKPVVSYGGESKIGWTDEVVHRVPIVIGEGVTSNWPAEIVRRTNNQHPDQDTDHWTPHPSTA